MLRFEVLELLFLVLDWLLISGLLSVFRIGAAKKGSADAAEHDHDLTDWTDISSISSVMDSVEIKHYLLSQNFRHTENTGPTQAYTSKDYQRARPLGVYCTLRWVEVTNM